jgi:hypothetical protein
MKHLVGIFLGMTLMTSNAEALDIGVGVKAGTLGAGVDLSIALTKTINARIGVTGVDVDSEQETLSVGDPGLEEDMNATLDADYGANGLLFDWYVFDGTFHVTAGMVKNNGAVDLSAALQTGVTYTVGGQPFDSNDIVGNIGGSVNLGDSYQPYLGIGWGRKADDDPGFSLSVELGVALLDPEAQLQATLNTGGSLTQPELDALLRDTEDEFESELDEFELFPVLSIGLNYAF